MSALLPELATDRDARRLDEAAHAVAQIAAQHADAVDRDARCPVEAIEAMRARRLLGAMVPTHLGGVGATLEDIASACSILGLRIVGNGVRDAPDPVACIVNHAADQAGTSCSCSSSCATSGCSHRPRRKTASAATCARASARSKPAAASSGCANPRRRSRMATTRTASSRPHDAMRTRRLPSRCSSRCCATATLTRRGEWDTLGMRGTCSNGFGRCARRRRPVPAGAVREDRRGNDGAGVAHPVGRGLDRRGRRRVPPRAPVLPRPGPPDRRRTVARVAAHRRIARADAGDAGPRRHRAAPSCESGVPFVVGRHGPGRRDQHAEDLRVDDRAGSRARR